MIKLSVNSLKSFFFILPWIILVGVSAVQSDRAIAETNRPLDKIVAFVNSDIITQNQLDAALSAKRKELIASRIPLPEPSVFRKSVLDLLIMEHLQLSIAEKSHIQVGEKDINQAIASMAKHNQMSIETFKHTLEQAGLNYKEYRNNIKKQVIMGRLQQKAVMPNVHVSEADIDRFMQEYRSQNRQTALEYHLWDWVVPAPTSGGAQKWATAQRQAQQLAQQLKEGKDPKAVMHQLQKHYQNEEDNTGGDLGWRRKADLPSLFIEPLRTLKVNGVSTPVRAENGFHVIQLLGTRDPSPPLSRETARPLVYRQAFQKALEKWLKDLKEAAYIKIA